MGYFENECAKEGCGGPAMDNGRCYHHGGRRQNGNPDPDGAPEGNQNAVSHGLYAELDNFYQNTLDDDHRRLCDEIFQDYCTEYREHYGQDIPVGIEQRLFDISVNQIKLLYANNWLENKAGELESGNPLVDRETHYSDGGTKYHRYKESVVIATQQKIRREDRAWLKDLGLLHDPESKKAAANRDLATWIADKIATE